MRYFQSDKQVLYLCVSLAIQHELGLSSAAGPVQSVGLKKKAAVIIFVIAVITVMIKDRFKYEYLWD